jgi:hypothetical protein
VGTHSFRGGFSVRLPAAVAVVVAAAAAATVSQAARADGCPTLTFSPASGSTLGAGSVGRPYSAKITVSGGSGSYYWQLGGYDVDQTGLGFPTKGFAGDSFTVTGTPTTAGGPFHISLNVWDAPSGPDGKPHLCNGLPTGASFQLMVSATGATTTTTKAPTPTRCTESFADDCWVGEREDLWAMALGRRLVTTANDADKVYVEIKIEPTSSPFVPVTPPKLFLPGGPMFIPADDAKAVGHDLGLLSTSLESGLAHVRSKDLPVTEEIKKAIIEAVASWSRPGSPSAAKAEAAAEALQDIQDAELEILKLELQAHVDAIPKRDVDAATQDVREAIALEQRASDGYHAHHPGGWHRSLDEARSMLDKAARAIFPPYETPPHSAARVRWDQDLIDALNNARAHDEVANKTAAVQAGGKYFFDDQMDEAALAKKELLRLLDNAPGR